MQPIRQPAMKIILASQYFVYFAGMGMVLPYFNLYCYHLGFSGFQIGLLSALRAVAMVVFPMAWGALADRSDGRRAIYIACAAASAAIWGLFLLTEDFAAMAAITVAYGIFYSPLISFLEASTMEALGREKKSYGRIRAWGSLSFIGVVLVFGRLIEAFSVRIIIGAVWIVSIAQAAAAVGVPAGRPGGKALFTREAGGLLRKPVLLFLGCGFLMLMSHGTYYGFFSIHLETLGYPSTFIGACWALASTAEILVMVRSEALFRRFSLEQVITASLAAAMLRWLVLAVATAPVLILLSQLLHAMSYGCFHMASILTMDRLSPAAAKTSGQALNNALTYGLGLMAGFFLNGSLYGRLGSFKLFLVSALIALAGGILFMGFRKTARGALSSAQGKV
jgi:PPP family 3-phenylpropionic acid transporter